MRRLYITVILAALLQTARPAGALEYDEGTFRSRQVGVRFEVPEGWTLHRQTGYPSLLTVLFHKAATISLSVGILPPKGLTSFVESNRKGMDAVGLRVLGSQHTTIGGRQVVRLELSHGSTRVRQLYFAHANQVLILTLTTEAQTLSTYAPELTQLLTGLRLTAPEARRTDDGAAGGGESNGGGGSRETSSGPNPPAATQPSSRPTPASRPSTSPTTRPGAAPQRRRIQEGVE